MKVNNFTRLSLLAPTIYTGETEAGGYVVVKFDFGLLTVSIDGHIIAQKRSGDRSERRISQRELFALLKTVKSIDVTEDDLMKIYIPHEGKFARIV